VLAAGCEIWYLSPYSPDYNEIEHRWFGLKNWMRQQWDEFDSFRDCVDAAFNQCPNIYAYCYTSARQEVMGNERSGASAVVTFL